MVFFKKNYLKRINKNPIFKTKNFNGIELLLYFKNLNFLKIFYLMLTLINKYNLSNQLKFNWFKFSLFMGLGYKKKISKLKNLLYLYIADRH